MAIQEEVVGSTEDALLVVQYTYLDDVSAALEEVVGSREDLVVVQCLGASSID